MKHPNYVFGRFVRGSREINDKLAQGWVIVDSERNFLLKERTTPKPDTDPEVAEKRKPGRPKKNNG